MDDDTPGGTARGARLLTGRVLADRYRIENVVSSGANTVIAEAIDTQGDRPVTLKVVRPELSSVEGFSRAFRRQAEVASALTHPNIAAVLDFGDTELDGEATKFWVVEYLGGGSLRDLFDRGRLLEPSQALVVGLEACRALDTAHQRGIVHTELTPSKLVFGEDGRLRIVDFAMAALMGAEAWAEPATVPTHVARYASPEQALGLPVDPKTDVYALSLCLIEAVTGNVPFAGDSTVSTLAGRVGKLMPVSADLGSLASVLERAGRPEAEDRSTAAEFGRALVRAAEQLPRPEPIPLMAASLFAVSQMRRPSDPTGGIERPDLPDDAEGEDVSAEGTADEAPLDEVAAEGPESLTIIERDPDTSESDAPPVDGDVDPEAATEPLLLVTDIAENAESGDDPTVDTDELDEPSSADGDDNRTAELPVALAAAAVAATTPPTTEIGVVESEPVDPTPSGILYDEEQRKSRPWGKIILLAIVIIAGVAALSYAGWLLLRTKSYEVPDLVGVERAVALNEISGNDWDIQQERERSDEVPDIDHVVRTMPAAGVDLDEGETFTIYVSDGPELRTLPELAGMTLAEAQTTLEDLRLVAAELPREFSETVPAGTVISWQVQDDASLAAGARVLPETTIELTVSKGPEPRPAPALRNMTLEEATAAVEGLQLVLVRGDDIFSDDVEIGRVVRQRPAPETRVERGGSITVRLSKGPDVVPIPDLAGMSYPDAEQALTDAGFVVDSLLGTTEGTFVSISVGGDEVQAGDTFLRGTGVDLVFL